MSKVCPNCGKKIDNNALFCTNCGFSLAAKAEEAVQNAADEIKASVQAADEAVLNDVKELEAAIEEARKAEPPIFAAAPAVDTAAVQEAEKIAREEEKAREAAAKAEKAAKAEAEKAEKAAAKQAEKEAQKAAKEAEKAAREAEKAAAKEAKKAARAPKKDVITEPVEDAKSYRSVGTGGYFFLMLLFAIPVIGWLACIIIALAAKNPSLKNFARAKLVWLVIALILMILLTLALLFFGQNLITAANASFGTNLSGLDDLAVALFSGSISLQSLFGLIFK